MVLVTMDTTITNLKKNKGQTIVVIGVEERYRG